MSINGQSNQEDHNRKIITLPDSKTLANALTGWTKEEKRALLSALKMYGSHNVEEIQKTVKSKTEKEITIAIDYYRKKVIDGKSTSLQKNAKKLRRLQQKPRVPLVQWVKTLTNSFSYANLHTEIVSALRLIAKLEDIPSSLQTEQIDFRKIYHLVADGIEGKPLTDNNLIGEIINSCLLEVVFISRSFLKPSSFKLVLNSVKFKEENPILGVHPSKDVEIGNLQYLICQRNFNPFNVPVHYLIPSKKEDSETN